MKTNNNVFRKILLSFCFLFIAVAMGVLGVTYMPKIVQAQEEITVKAGFNMLDGAGLRLQNVPGNGEQLRFTATMDKATYESYSANSSVKWYFAMMPKSMRDTVLTLYNNEIDINEPKLYAFSPDEFRDMADDSNAPLVIKNGKYAGSKGPIFIMWNMDDPLYGGNDNGSDDDEYATFRSQYSTRTMARLAVVNSQVVTRGKNGAYGWGEQSVTGSNFARYEIWGTLGGIYENHLADKYTAQAMVRVKKNADSSVETTCATMATDRFRSPLDVSIRTVDNGTFDNDLRVINYTLNGQSESGNINKYLNDWVTKFNTSNAEKKTFKYTVHNYYIPTLKDGGQQAIFLEKTEGYANANQSINELRTYANPADKTSTFDEWIMSYEKVATLNVTLNQGDSNYNNSTNPNYIYTTNDDEIVAGSTKFVELTDKDSEIKKMYAGDGELVINRYFTGKTFHQVTDGLIYGDPANGVYAERAIREGQTQQRPVDLGQYYSDVVSATVTTANGVENPITVTSVDGRYLMDYASFANGLGFDITTTSQNIKYSRNGETVTEESFKVPNQEADGKSYNVEIIAKKDVISGSVMDVTFAIETRNDLDNWHKYAYRDEGIWNGYIVLANDIFYSIAKSKSNTESSDLYYTSYDTYDIMVKIGIDGDNDWWDTSRYGFKGTFDGRGYNIDNIRFNGATCGLVGMLNASGTIKNLSMTNASVHQGSGSILSNCVSGTIRDVYIHVASLTHGGNPCPTAVIGANHIGSTAHISRVVVEGGSIDSSDPNVSIFGSAQNDNVYYTENFYIGPEVALCRKRENSTSSPELSIEKQSINAYENRNQFIEAANKSLNFVGWGASDGFWKVDEDNTPYPRQLAKKLINSYSAPMAVSTSSVFYDKGNVSNNKPYRFEVPTVKTGNTVDWRLGRFTQIFNTENICARIATNRYNVKDPTKEGDVIYESDGGATAITFGGASNGTSLNKQNSDNATHTINFNRDNGYFSFVENIRDKNNKVQLTTSQFHTYRLPTADYHIALAITADLVIEDAQDFAYLNAVADAAVEGTEYDWKYHDGDALDGTGAIELSTTSDYLTYHGDLLYGGRIVLAGNIDYEEYDMDGNKLTIKDGDGTTITSNRFIPAFVQDTFRTVTVNETTTKINVYDKDANVGFKGTFDGRGYNINGLQIGTMNDNLTCKILGNDHTGDIFGSLFTVLHSEGVIKNVSFTKAEIHDSTGFLTNVSLGKIQDVYIHATYAARGYEKSIKVDGESVTERHSIGFVCSSYGYGESVNERIVVYLDEYGENSLMARLGSEKPSDSTTSSGFAWKFSTILGSFGDATATHRTLDGVLAIGDIWAHYGSYRQDLGFYYDSNLNAANKDTNNGYWNDGALKSFSIATKPSWLDYEDGVGNGGNGNKFPDLGDKYHWDSGWVDKGELGKGRLTDGDFIIVDQRFYPSYIFRTTYNLIRMGWSFNYSNRFMDFNANDPGNVTYDQTIMGITSSTLDLVGSTAVYNKLSHLSGSETDYKLTNHTGWDSNGMLLVGGTDKPHTAGRYYGPHFKVAPEITNAKDFEYSMEFTMSATEFQKKADGTNGDPDNSRYPALVYHANYTTSGSKEMYSSAYSFNYRIKGQNAHTTFGNNNGAATTSDSYVMDADAPNMVGNYNYTEWYGNGNFYRLGYKRTDSDTSNVKHILKVVVEDGFAYYYAGNVTDGVELQNVINISGKNSSGGFGLYVNGCDICITKINIKVNSWDTSNDSNAGFADTDYVAPISSDYTQEGDYLYKPNTKLVAPPTIVQEVDSVADYYMMTYESDRRIAQNTIFYVDKDMYLTAGKIDSVNNTSSRLTKSKKDIQAWASEEGQQFKLHYAIKRLKGRSLPVVYIPGFPTKSGDTYTHDLTIARKFVQYYKESISISDMTVMSDSYEVLQYIYSEIPHLRRALDWTGQGESAVSEGINIYNWLTYSSICNAQIVVLDKKQANEVVVRSLQARFKTVWVDIQDDSALIANSIELAKNNPNGNPHGVSVPTVQQLQELYVSKAIANGALGIMTTDCKTAFGVFDDNTNPDNLYKQLSEDKGVDFIMSRTPFSIGHRGAPDSGYIENSIQGIQYAKTVATHVEIDVQMSSDRKLYLFHDGTLDELSKTNGSGTIKSKDSSALDAIRYVYGSDGGSQVDWTGTLNYANQGDYIAKFDRLFAEFATKDKYDGLALSNTVKEQPVLVLELKAKDDYDMLYELKRYIDDYENKPNASDRRYIKQNMVFICFHENMVNLARGLFPEVPIAFLGSRDSNNYVTDGVKWLTSKGAVHDAQTTHTYSVEESIYRGMPLFQWTYTTATSAVDGIKQGIMGITNDDPQGLSALVYKLRWTVDGQNFYAHTYNKNATGYDIYTATMLQHGGIPKQDANYNGWMFFSDNVQCVVLETTVQNTSYTNSKGTQCGDRNNPGATTTLKYAVLV